ncbi:hypothetical protein [Parahaliea maris]|uniref:hypothetical protein n=1 Tax=Parahaliea maris TaxID=2716870 RepID=UPI00164F31BB|nr:hypothetical protein [Parahaliea maris]
MTRVHLWGILASLMLVLAVLLLGPYSSPDQFLPDQGTTWYYWKLPEQTTAGRISAWVLYLAHQVSIWWLIARFRAQPRGGDGAMQPLNWLAIAVNGLFILLHILQTRLFYDGLAQDTSVMTSQGSVVLLLVMVLLFENQRRGLFFGQRLHWLQRPGAFLRQYHGYYFAWAITFTFWFHPIEDNAGHLLGLLYTFLILFQGSLVRTRYHSNRYWTVLLECFVAVHGGIVAYLTQSTGVWRMFFFGFMALFIVTQIHGLGLKRRWIALAGLTYLGAVGAAYWGEGTKFLAVIRIPLVEYGLVLAMGALIWAGFWLRRTTTTLKGSAPPPRRG